MFPRPPQRRPYKAPPFLIGHQGYPGAFYHSGASAKMELSLF